MKRFKRSRKDLGSKPRARRLGLLLVWIGLTAVLSGAGFLGWHWWTNVRCEAIEVRGTLTAHADEIVALTHVDTSMALYRIDPVLIRDRVRRHPWVRDARISRYPSGVLAVEIVERRPVALAIDEGGHPQYYLDPAGYPMPVTEQAAFDVPLIRGLGGAYHPLQPIGREPVPALLAALDCRSAQVDALLSEFIVQPSGDVWVHLSPVEGHGSIPVRLGKDHYEEKFDRLLAFWRQAVLTRADRNYEMIDLRFDGQVVTREKATG